MVDRTNRSRCLWVGEHSLLQDVRPPAAFGQLKQEARKDIVEGSLSASRLKGSTRLTPRELAFRFASDLAFIPPPFPGFRVIVCYASLWWMKAFHFGSVGLPYGMGCYLKGLVRLFLLEYPRSEAKILSFLLFAFRLLFFSICCSKWDWELDFLYDFRSVDRSTIHFFRKELRGFGPGWFRE